MTKEYVIQPVAEEGPAQISLPSGMAEGTEIRWFRLGCGHEAHLAVHISEGPITAIGCVQCTVERDLDSDTAGAKT